MVSEKFVCKCATPRGDCKADACLAIIKEAIPSRYKADDTKFFSNFGWRAVNLQPDGNFRSNLLRMGEKTCPTLLLSHNHSASSMVVLGAILQAGLSENASRCLRLEYARRQLSFYFQLNQHIFADFEVHTAAVSSSSSYCYWEQAAL